MRLNPGVTLAHADDVLRRAESTWGNARSLQDRYRAYTDAVHETYPTLTQVFATPDIDANMRSPAYWNLLSLGNSNARNSGVITDPMVAHGLARVQAAQNQALNTEVNRQVRFLDVLRDELEALKKLATRTGLPVIYDTNMLNHWRQPGDILWQDILNSHRPDTTLVRLVVPLRVIDELDNQKYGEGELAKRATTAIRYLERALKDSPPGEPVRLRRGVTLEVWLDTDREGPADLAILRCAADLAKLHPEIVPCVLTDDFGMRLSANQMGLSVLSLPSDHRKSPDKVKAVSHEGQHPTDTRQ